MKTPFAMLGLVVASISIYSAIGMCSLSVAIWLWFGTNTCAAEWPPRDPGEYITKTDFTVAWARKLLGFKTLDQLQKAAGSKGTISGRQLEGEDAHGFIPLAQRATKWSPWLHGRYRKTKWDYCSECSDGRGYFDHCEHAGRPDMRQVFATDRHPGHKTAMVERRGIRPPSFPYERASSIQVALSPFFFGWNVTI